MNPDAKTYLDQILAKNPDSLTEPERIFLRARRGYLKSSQLEEYKSVLEAEEPNRELAEPDGYDGQPPTYLSTKDLKAKAEGLGIDIKGKNRQEIEDLIKAEEIK